MTEKFNYFACQGICWILFTVLGAALMAALMSWVGFNFFYALVVAVVVVVLAAIYVMPMICGETEQMAPASTQPAAPAAAPVEAAAPVASEPEAAAQQPAEETPEEAPAEDAAAQTEENESDAPFVPAAAAPGAAADDLTRINGVGKVLANGLAENGVTTFAQIAAWGPKEIDWADNDLAKFKGRCTRDDWVGQAKELAKG